VCCCSTVPQQLAFALLQHNHQLLAFALLQHNHQQQLTAANFWYVYVFASNLDERQE
jgi:hypothetical protein